LPLIAFNWQSNAQLTEGFEGGVVPPEGWASYVGTGTLAGTVVWMVDADANANTGSNAAYNQYDTPAGGVTQDWLVTSAIDLAGVSGSELRFFTKQ
jgi:hypothetical protein